MERKNIKDLYEGSLGDFCQFLAIVKINDVKKMPYSKRLRDIVWKELAIPFKSYLHINDLSWEDVKNDIIFKTKETAKVLGADNEIKERGKKALENGGYILASFEASDVFNPMEIRIIVFLNEGMEKILEENGIETDTAFNEYFTYMVDYMNQENKIA